MVVADTFEAAREGAHRMKISYDTEIPTASFDSKGATEAAVKKEHPKAGDAVKAFDDAEVKLEVAYGTPTQHHNPIELFTTTAVWNNDELTIYEPSQFMYGLMPQNLGSDVCNSSRCGVDYCHQRAQRQR